MPLGAVVAGELEPGWFRSAAEVGGSVVAPAVVVGAGGLALEIVSAGAAAGAGAGVGPG